MDADGDGGVEDKVGFQLDWGSGGRTGILEYTKIHRRHSGHKTAVLALTRWVLSAGLGPALDSTSILEG